MLNNMSQPLAAAIYFSVIVLAWGLWMYSAWFATESYRSLQKKLRSTVPARRMFFVSLIATILGILCVSLGVYAVSERALLSSLDPSLVTVSDHRKIQALEIYASLGVVWCLTASMISCQWLSEKTKEMKEISEA